MNVEALKSLYRFYYIRAMQLIEVNNAALAREFY